MMERQQVEQIMFGSVKMATRNFLRDKKTRGRATQNGRSVARLWPLDPLIARPEPDDDDEDRHTQRVQIIQSQIREALPDQPLQVTLAWRHLFLGEAVSKLADELGINPGTAASAVSRVRRYLGLTGK